MSRNSEVHSPLNHDSPLTDRPSRKVLIITYYWPPSGGSGVQRWLKFVKYLPAYNWEPHVFTPENPSFALRDDSLERDVPPEAEVMRFPIWEPYDAFFRLSRIFGSAKRSTPATTSTNTSLFQRIGTWIRGNFFIPDPRVFWVRPSVKFLTDYVKDNGIQTIITTGPPHSVHLIGLKLKKRYPQLRWLADFRDPWSEWGLWDSLNVSRPVRNVHKKMERRVLTTADEIITITPFYKRRFEVLSGRRVRLLTNGFDDDDFIDFVYRKPAKFTIRHVGIVNEKCDPRLFMRALKNEMGSTQDFAGDVILEFNGEVNADFRKFVEQDPELNNVTRFTGNLTHEKLLRRYGSTSLLLLVLTGYKDAEGFLPGKLFEYLATGLPVLGVGPTQGDAAFVLKTYEPGTMTADDDMGGMQAALRNAWEWWKSDGQPLLRREPGTHEFSRRNVSRKLADILEEHTDALRQD